METRGEDEVSTASDRLSVEQFDFNPQSNECLPADPDPRRVVAKRSRLHAASG